MNVGDIMALDERVNATGDIWITKAEYVEICRLYGRESNNCRRRIEILGYPCTVIDLPPRVECQSCRRPL